eukprot:SAG11_NODE_8258_length_1038_cov_2.312034_1_plen_259_part_10
METASWLGRGMTGSALRPTSAHTECLVGRPAAVPTSRALFLFLFLAALALPRAAAVPLPAFAEETLTHPLTRDEMTPPLDDLDAVPPVPPPLLMAGFGRPGPHTRTLKLFICGVGIASTLVIVPASRRRFYGFASRRLLVVNPDARAVQTRAQQQQPEVGGVETASWLGRGMTGSALRPTSAHIECLVGRPAAVPTSRALFLFLFLAALALPRAAAVPLPAFAEETPTHPLTRDEMTPPLDDLDAVPPVPPPLLMAGFG